MFGNIYNIVLKLYISSSYEKTSTMIIWKESYDQNYCTSAIVGENLFKIFDYSVLVILEYNVLS